MKRPWFLLIVCLAWAGTAFAVQPGNHEGKFLTPRQAQALSMPADSVHSYDVRFYRLDIKLPMTNDAMTAHERVTIACRVPSLDTFSLDMVSLVCDSVKRGGVTLSFTQPSGELAITLNSTMHSGDSTDLDIFYHRNSGTPLQGFYWYSRGSNGVANICYSTTEPSDSRYWFPCWDQPWDKADRGCQINVTVPDTFLACCNGLLDSTTANASAHTKTFWWTEHYPISTYLMAFSASRYSTWKQRWARAPGDTIDVEYYIWPTDSSRSVTAFQNVPDMLSFFNRADVYGPYPFEKYGMDAVSPFQWGGMENQTMTMINRSWLNGDDEGIAHEMSHQWWGDMVTCFTWPNIWLNEGFATYSEALYMEHQQGHAYFISDLNSFANSYFSSDAGYRFPMYDPPSNYLFDWGTIYCKGAWVQHMLRYVEHDTSATHGTFFTALRAYGDSLKYGNASTPDYQRIHERFYGDTLNWFFNEWVYLAGYPQYTVNWYGASQGSNWKIVVDVSQNNGSGAPPVFHMPVEILFHLSGKDTLVHYPITASPQRDTFIVSAQPQSAVFDPYTWILKKITLTSGVEQNPEVTAAPHFMLGQNVPDPFNSATQISYSLPSEGPAKLAVYDVLGHKVRTLLDGEKQAGTYQVGWDGRDERGKPVSSGVYFYRLEASGKTLTARAVKIR